jgi:uncharacterized protein
MEVKTVPTPTGRPTIQSYSPDGFRISGAIYSNPIFVFADGVVEWHFAMPVGVDAFAIAIERRGDFDLLLVGYGEERDSFPPGLATSLREQRLHCELMGTGAACRTYNLLTAEGRRVAAALLPLH